MSQAGSLSVAAAVVLQTLPATAAADSVAPQNEKSVATAYAPPGSCKVSSELIRAVSLSEEILGTSGTEIIKAFNQRAHATLTWPDHESTRVTFYADYPTDIEAPVTYEAYPPHEGFCAPQLRIAVDHILVSRRLPAIERFSLNRNVADYEGEIPLEIVAATDEHGRLATIAPVGLKIESAHFNIEPLAAHARAVSKAAEAKHPGYEARYIVPSFTLHTGDQEDIEARTDRRKALEGNLQYQLAPTVGSPHKPTEFDGPLLATLRLDPPATSETMGADARAGKQYLETIPHFAPTGECMQCFDRRSPTLEEKTSLGFSAQDALDRFNKDSDSDVEATWFDGSTSTLSIRAVAKDGTINYLDAARGAGMCASEMVIPVNIAVKSLDGRLAVHFGDPSNDLFRDSLELIRPTELIVRSDGMDGIASITLPRVRAEATAVDSAAVRNARESAPAINDRHLVSIRFNYSNNAFKPCVNGEIVSDDPSWQCSTVEGAMFYESYSSYDRFQETTKQLLATWKWMKPSAASHRHAVRQ